MRAIIGAKGRIGSALIQPDSILIEAGDTLDFQGADTVIHAGIDWSRRGRPHLNDVLDALDAAATQGVLRFIYTSSVWADPYAYGLFGEGFTDYTAAKRGAEAFLQHWQDASPGRAAVALRVGSFNPGTTTDEAWKLTTKGLLFHVERAELVNGYHCWVAMGDGGKQERL